MRKDLTIRIEVDTDENPPVFGYIRENNDPDAAVDGETVLDVMFELVENAESLTNDAFAAEKALLVDTR